MQLHGLSARAALMFVCRRNVPSSMPVPSLPVLVAYSPRAPRDRAADYWPAEGPWVRPAWRPPRPRGGWEEWPIGRPHRVQSDFWPYHASKKATAHWLATLPSDRRKRRHRGQFSDPDLAFVTESREHQENPSREWSVGELEYGARPTFPPANVHPDAAVPPSALNESRDVHPCLRLRALPEGAIWNAVGAPRMPLIVTSRRTRPPTGSLAVMRTPNGAAAQRPDEGGSLGTGIARGARLSAGKRSGPKPRRRRGVVTHLGRVQ